MRHTPRVLVSGTVTGLLALGLVGSPAEAYTKREKRAEKRQNTAIKKTSRSVGSLRKSTKLTDDALGKLAGTAAANNKSNADTIAAVVPVVTTALTQLRDGLTAAGAGLGQLKTGLEAAGVGIGQLKTGLETAGASITALAAAQEFGVVQLYAGDTAVAGQILTSSDIPDDSNPAVLTGKFLLPVPNGAAGVPLTLRAAIRSGEKDGVAGGNAAGVAGLQSMTVNDASTNVTIGGGNPGTPPNGQVPLTSKANPGAGGAPVYPIALKAPRVDETPNPFAFPNGQAIDLTDPATLQTLTAPPGKYTVSNDSGAAGIATVDFTVRFHDLSASATDLNE